jgi:predicted  nucleic acid-binding Zn-ribbon protein
MSTQCTTCGGTHFVVPKNGQKSLTMPCPECNSEWTKNPAPKVPTDEDKFPFGKHKDWTYGSIPDSYFIWLIDQPWIGDWPQVKQYIEENFKDELA